MAALPPMTDDVFLARFNALSLLLAAFNHLGHLRVAWILLQRFPPPNAIELVCSGIARFAAHARLRSAARPLARNPAPLPWPASCCSFAVMRKPLTKSASALIQSRQPVDK